MCSEITKRWLKSSSVCYWLETMEVALFVVDFCAALSECNRASSAMESIVFGLVSWALLFSEIFNPFNKGIPS
jgi:hypothetical protein